MASPQLENGHTRIANELFDHMIKVSIPGRHKDLWWFVVRKTYGYGKKRDWIPLSQFEKGTGIDRSGVCKIIKDLVAWKLLVKKDSIYAINKNYEEWGSGVRTTGGSGVANNLLVACAPHSKETLQKKYRAAKAALLPIKGKSMKTYKEPVIEIDPLGETVTEALPPKIGEVMKKIINGYNKDAKEALGMEGKNVDYVGMGGRKMLSDILKDKNWTKEKVVDLLKTYLKSAKFEKHHEITAALSNKTKNLYEEGNL